MNTANFTQQDIINAQTSAKIDIQNTKIDAFIEEMRDFKNEMRDRDAQRHAENQAHHAEMQNIGRHVRNLTIASMVGIGAMALSGGAIAVAVVYSLLTSAAK